MSRLCLVGALVGLLAGCGGASGSGLEGSAEATEAAETARFEVAYRFVDLGGKEEKLSATGVIDFPGERMAMNVADAAKFESPLELRLLGKVGYVKWVVKGRTVWEKQEEVEPSGDPAEFLIPGPGTLVKPTDVLARVLLASDENDEVGQEDIRGTETTHYRARVDLEKVVQQMPESERPEGDFQELWGARFVPVELWIDDESRLRRIQITRPAEEENANPETIMTADLFEYGVEVNVEPPPSDQVMSHEEFESLTDSMTDTNVCESLGKELPKKQADRACLEVKEQQ